MHQPCTNPAANFHANDTIPRQVHSSTMILRPFHTPCFRFFFSLLYGIYFKRWNKHDSWTWTLLHDADTPSLCSFLMYSFLSPPSVAVGLPHPIPLLPRYTYSAEAERITLKA